MNNLLNLEIYKLFKRKSFYICFAILLFFGITNTITFSVMDKFLSLEELEALGMGYLLSTDFNSYILQILGDTDTILIILAVFTSLFISSDYSSGAIKNISSRGYSRLSIYLSKLVTVLFATLIYLVIYIVFITGISALIWGTSDFTAVLFKEALAIISTQIFIYLAMIAIYMLVGTIFENGALVVTINVGFTFLSVLIFQIVDLLLKSDLIIGKFWLTSMIAQIAHYKIDISEMTRVLITTGVYFIIAIVFGCIHFIKKDIK